MLTPEQIDFLAEFADKGIAEQKAAQQRNIDDAAAYEAKIAREAFLAELEAKKDQEITQALADYDFKNG